MESGVIGVATVVVRLAVGFVSVLVRVPRQGMLDPDVPVVVDDKNHPVAQAQHAA
jgi:hypothetical protein